MLSFIVIFLAPLSLLFSFLLSLFSIYIYRSLVIILAFSLYLFPYVPRFSKFVANRLSLIARSSLFYSLVFLLLFLAYRYYLFLLFSFVIILAFIRSFALIAIILTLIARTPYTSPSLHFAILTLHYRSLTLIAMYLPFAHRSLLSSLYIIRLSLVFRFIFLLIARAINLFD